MWRSDPSGEPVLGAGVYPERRIEILHLVQDDSETRELNKAVKRNLERFPEDFMFQLTYQEVRNLKFQFGTSSWGGTFCNRYV